MPNNKAKTINRAILFFFIRVSPGISNQNVIEILIFQIFLYYNRQYAECQAFGKELQKINAFFVNLAYSSRGVIDCFGRLQG